MRLRSDTVCTLYDIKTGPQWNGKAERREVGLAEYRMTKHNEVIFSYRRKTGPTAGQLSLPGSYYFDGDTRDNYPRKKVKGGVTLVMVPLTALPPLERYSPVKVITNPREMPPLISKIFFNYDKENV
jgi:hypothetical protein